MKNLKQRQAKVLQETLEYYQQDPEGRRCTYDSVCSYSPKTVGKESTSEGCAVGRLLTPELRERLDRENEGDNSNQVFFKLPIEIQELGKGFLKGLQCFHDEDSYWDMEGLTEEGKEQYNRLVEKIEEGYYIE